MIIKKLNQPGKYFNFQQVRLVILVNSINLIIIRPAVIIFMYFSSSHLFTLYKIKACGRRIYKICLPNFKQTFIVQTIVITIFLELYNAEMKFHVPKYFRSLTTHAKGFREEDRLVFVWSLYSFSAKSFGCSEKLHTLCRGKEPPFILCG